MDRFEDDTPFRFWPALGLVVLLLVGLVGASYYLSANSTPQSSPGPQIGVGGGPDESPVPSPQSDLILQIRDNPEYYYGQPVILNGKVESTRDQRIFVLSSDDRSGRLLVLSRTPLSSGTEASSSPLFRDDEVTITGTIRSFNIVELQRELNFEIDQSVQAEFENQPVIVADSIQAAPQTTPSD